MRRFLLPLLLAAAGCSSDPPPLPMATTPGEARAAFTAAFEAWKAGETPDKLTARTPPVYFQDEDFTRGRKLTSYAVEGEPQPYGTGISYVVNLTLADGKARRLAYRVVTRPNVSVSREDRTP